MRLSNGTIIHNRNLDFNFANETTRATYIAKFMKGDQYLFDATMFAGYTGILSGMRKDGFSLTINTRKPSMTTDFTNMLANVFLFFGNDNHQPPKIARDVFLSCETYECAVKMLKEAKLTAPVFFTIAGVGPNEGAIISRDR